VLVDFDQENLEEASFAEVELERVNFVQELPEQECFVLVNFDLVFGLGFVLGFEQQEDFEPDFGLENFVEGDFAQAHWRRVDFELGSGHQGRFEKPDFVSVNSEWKDSTQAHLTREGFELGFELGSVPDSVPDSENQENFEEQRDSV